MRKVGESFFKSTFLRGFRTANKPRAIKLVRIAEVRRRKTIVNESALDRQGKGTNKRTTRADTKKHTKTASTSFFSSSLALVMQL